MIADLLPAGNARGALVAAAAYAVWYVLDRLGPAGLEVRPRPRRPARHFPDAPAAGHLRGELRRRPAGELESRR